LDNENEVNVIETLTKEEKNAAKLLVKNLTIDFNSRNFENPSLQCFFSGLQALALNEGAPEKVEDHLEPDYKGMKKFEPVLDNFKNIFFDGNDTDPACS
jgi:ATP-dependent DNA helicase 2 subunit 1